MPLSMFAGMGVGMLAGIAAGGVLVLLLAYSAVKEYREDAGDDALRSVGESTAGGVRGAFTLGRGLGFAGFVVIETLIAETLNVGLSIFDLLGPLVSSNLLAIGLGTAGLFGWVPVDPIWYAGVMLMMLGIAISSAGSEIYERMA